MRIALAFVAAVMFGVAVGGAIPRHDNPEPAMLVKTQDRLPIDQPKDEVARAQPSRSNY
jgi:hypothetical protein